MFIVRRPSAARTTAVIRIVRRSSTALLTAVERQTKKQKHRNNQMKEIRNKVIIGERTRCYILKKKHLSLIFNHKKEDAKLRPLIFLSYSFSL